MVIPYTDSPEPPGSLIKPLMRTLPKNHFLPPCFSLGPDRNNTDSLKHSLKLRIPPNVRHEFQG